MPTNARSSTCSPICCRGCSRTGRMRPMRWRSPSATLGPHARNRGWRRQSGPADDRRGRAAGDGRQMGRGAAMIGKSAGRIDYKAEDHVLIEAGGIGYIVHCAPGTLSALPAPGEAASRYTEMIVRQDLMQLFGFRSLAEREWHRILTSVQGVGPRVSLSLIDALGLSGLGRAVASGDTAALRRAPGVGPRLATRITSELKDKAPVMMALGAGPAVAPTASDATAEPAETPAPAQEAKDQAQALA